jgi:hypothetical protein
MEVVSLAVKMRAIVVKTNRNMMKHVGPFNHAIPKMVFSWLLFLNEAYYNNADCKPSNHFYATISVQPVDKNAHLKRNELHKYRYSHSEQYINHLGSKYFHKTSLAVTSNEYDGSWGVSNIWGSRTTV